MRMEYASPGIAERMKLKPADVIRTQPITRCALNINMWLHSQVLSQMSLVMAQSPLKRNAMPSSLQSLPLVYTIFVTVVTLKTIFELGSILTYHSSCGIISIVL